MGGIHEEVDEYLHDSVCIHQAVRKVVRESLDGFDFPGCQIVFHESECLLDQRVDGCLHDLQGVLTRKIQQVADHEARAVHGVLHLAEDDARLVGGFAHCAVGAV